MKILDEVEAQVGRWAIAAGAIVLVVHFVWHRKNPVQPVVPITPAPWGPAVAAPIESTPPPTAAVAQANTATTTHVHIVIHRWPRSWVLPSGRRPLPRGSGASAMGAGTDPGAGATPAAPSANATDSPPIEIDVTTTSTAIAVAAATASAPLLPTAAVSPEHLTVPDHGRMGVLAAIVPGVLAADIEAIQFRTPWWLVGQPVEIGIDAQANLAEAGAGITVGSKAFAEAGGFLGYDGHQRGLYVGGGLRF